jgi:hypothetical protein
MFLSVLLLLMKQLWHPDLESSHPNARKTDRILPSNATAALVIVGALIHKVARSLELEPVAQQLDADQQLLSA